MNPVDFILTKRQGGTHAAAELDAVMAAYMRDDIPDYQMASWLMAVCFRGMTDQETADLTRTMAASGDMLDLSGLPHTVDKHSTGGVGDKTSLVLGPLLAEAGATVAKMSGRGLGHTGGTVDKLESIPGFRTELSDREFLEQAASVGVVIVGQSRDLAPLDGRLYALRDATGTVESLPLIASSIMSKKLAGGARSLVLDVKVGSGAFMKDLDSARELARAMIRIGRHAGLSVRAVLSAMDRPLGREIGNSGEVLEAADCLRGRGPADLQELCVILAEQLLAAAGIPKSREQLLTMLHDGSAWSRFESWIAAQGGDPSAVSGLPLAPDVFELKADRDGVVSGLDALAIGRAVGALGGGRQFKGQEIDHGVGIRIEAGLGSTVRKGDTLLLVRHRGGHGLERARELLAAAVRIGASVDVGPLVQDVIAD